MSFVLSEFRGTCQILEQGPQFAVTGTGCIQRKSDQRFIRVLDKCTEHGADFIAARLFFDLHGKLQAP